MIEKNKQIDVHMTMISIIICIIQYSSKVYWLLNYQYSAIFPPNL